MTNTVVSKSAPEFAQEGVPYDVKAEVERINILSSQDFAYEEEGQRRAYRRVAQMLGFVEQVHKNPLYKTAWDKERSARQVSIPSDGANPYLQYIKVLDGRFRPDLEKVEFDGEKVIKWEYNRSSEKYAKAIRWCIENDVTSDVAADCIENYVNPDDKDEIGLRGIEEADKRAHPAPERISSLKEAEKKVVQEAEGLFKLPDSIANHVKFHGEFAAVILRRHKGRIVILDDAGLSANQITNAVKSRSGRLKTAKAMEVVVDEPMLERYRALAAEKATQTGIN